MRTSLIVTAAIALAVGTIEIASAQYFTIGSQVWASDVTNSGVVVGY